MRYLYEALDGVRFQKLVQSLVVKEHPDVQCLPAPQPDGGRDAFYYIDISEKREFVVFQVKFTENPKSKDERDLISDVIRSEKAKVKELVEKGAVKFLLVTNVSGTSYPDSGSIDQANSELADEFGIPSGVWWRDDIDRRLDGHSDIKWSFSDILAAPDVLQMLVEALKKDVGKVENGRGQEVANTIAAYLGEQYGHDRDVKFKQVDLKRRLTELFVDLPVGLKRPSRYEKYAENDQNDGSLRAYLSQLKPQTDRRGARQYGHAHNGRAAAFLLEMPYFQGASRLVIEGGPGQGKSTVSQYLCQVNRLKLLANFRGELEDIAETHRYAPSRTPFRVDLRDFAKWIVESQESFETPNPRENRAHSLEMFLAHQVQELSGGQPISLDELLVFLRSAPCLIVLDGFDEVADTKIRAEIVRQVCSASNRFDAQAVSVQIIVTSRPSAFANSPGFPEEDWEHLELTHLESHDIALYQEKWSRAQNQTEEESQTLAIMLETKLRQSHLRDLARNPMQLAILLHLMLVQGDALPDKRTTLYEEYMKLFLNREIEKKLIEGNDRGLILSLHGLLAWLLQRQAELGEGAGSISKEDLSEVVKNYLYTEGYPADRAERLFQGTTERLGALVSRVEGMYEFEVQPLREYFAATYLKETILYVPANNPSNGSLPERFAVLAQNNYWTNVTRFFCGLCNKGELSALVDGLYELAEDGDYSLISQPRILAIMLLEDHVFSHAPKTVRRLVDFILSGSGFQRLMADGTNFGSSVPVLPEEAGRTMLAEGAAARLKEETDPWLCSVLRRVLSLNSPVSERKLALAATSASDEERFPFLRAVYDLDLEDHLSPDEICHSDLGTLGEKVRLLWTVDELDFLASRSELYPSAISAVLSGDASAPLSSSPETRAGAGLALMGELLQPDQTLYEVLHNPGRADPRSLVEDRIWLSELGSPPAADEELTDEQRMVDNYAQFVVKLFRKEGLAWHANLEPWSDLVDGGIRYLGPHFLFTSIAFLAAYMEPSELSPATDPHAGDERDNPSGVEQQNEPNGHWDDRGFSTEEGLVGRLSFAKQKKDDADWWRDQFRGSSQTDRIVLVAACIVWAEASVVKALALELNSFVGEISDEDWRRVIELIDWRRFHRGLNTADIEQDIFDHIPELSHRFVYLVGTRFAEGEDVGASLRTHLLDYEGSDDHILNLAFRREVFQSAGLRASSDVDWVKLKRLSMSARKAGGTLASNAFRGERINMPYDHAVDVLENCHQHDPGIIFIAERSIHAHVAKRTLKISEAADNGRWFESVD